MADDKQLEGVQIAIVSGGLKDEDLRLYGVWGRERISALFEYDLLFSRAGQAPFTFDELDALMGAPCAVALGPRPGDVVHGVLESVVYLDSTRSVVPRYRARLVPTVWLLTLARPNRLFQDVTIPELIEKVLGQYGLAKGSDFEIRTKSPGPSREYIVQFDESDWDFLQRWMEHEGLFYWFEHGSASEKLVIADSNDFTTAIDDPKAISYRERNNLSAGRLATIWEFGFEQRRVPARVAVFDYNYRSPSLDLFVKQEVDTKRGFGSVFHWGEHFKDNDQGKLVATARAERHLTERVTFRGATDCSRFRVGHSFELENHHHAELDKRYLITELRHGVGTPVSTDDQATDGGAQRYHARFSAILLSTPFRPARVTRRPRIDSVMHAHIESDGAGDYAQIDSLGRYKVRLPFDGGDAKGSKASRWIRMAQPYAGAGYGTHFPLHKGTEVLLVHVNGDPDRPIIVASVPNPHTASPSTSANATQSVIQTASGLRIEMEDRQP